MSLNFRTTSLMLLWVSFRAFSGSNELPNNFKYEQIIESGKKLSGPMVDDINELSAVFAEHGFDGLNNEMGNGHSFFEVDQIFARPVDSKAVFFKANLSPSNKKLIGKLHKIEERFVYHGSTPNGLAFALMFEGFTDADLAKFVTYLEEVRVGEAISKNSIPGQIYGKLLPSAQAGEGHSSDTRQESLRQRRSYRTTSSKNVLPVAVPVEYTNKAEQNLANNIEQFVKGSSGVLTRCLCEGLMGGVNHTIGLAIGAAKIVYKKTLDTFITVGDMARDLSDGNPRKFWSRVGNGFKSIGRGVWNLVTLKPLRDLAGETRDNVVKFFKSSPVDQFSTLCYHAGSIAAMYGAEKAVGRFVRKARRFGEEHVAPTTPQAIKEAKDLWDNAGRAVGIRVDKPATKALQAIVSKGSLYTILDSLVERPEYCKRFTSSY